MLTRRLGSSDLLFKRESIESKRHLDFLGVSKLLIWSVINFTGALSEKNFCVFCLVLFCFFVFVYASGITTVPTTKVSVGTVVTVASANCATLRA
jgi:hypothetical protein